MRCRCQLWYGQTHVLYNKLLLWYYARPSNAFLLPGSRCRHRCSRRFLFLCVHTWKWTAESVKKKKKKNDFQFITKMPAMSGWFYCHFSHILETVQSPRKEIHKPDTSCGMKNTDYLKTDFWNCYDGFRMPSQMYFRSVTQLNEKYHLLLLMCMAGSCS